MAVSYIGGHNTNNVTPAYNRVNYYFDSTNKNQPGFRYVIDLYLGGTATKIWESRIAPRIVDGYAVVQLQKIVSSLLSTDLSLTNLNTIDCPKSHQAYTLKIGEEYAVSYAISSFTNDGGRVRVTTAANTFAVGDQVVVNDPLLSGLFTVVTDTSTTQITIDAPWNAAYAGATTGTITYADNRKTITRDLNTQSFAVWNGVLANDVFRSYVLAEWKLVNTGTSGRFLTDMPQTAMTITPTADVYLNWCNYIGANGTRMYFRNDAGDTFYKTVGTTTAGVRQTSCGANNLGTLTLVSGTAPLIKPTTSSYEVWLADVSAVQYTRKYKFTLDKRCAINDVQLLFMDRGGSYVPFSCQLRKRRKGTTKRETYLKDLGDLSGGKWTYTNDQLGLTTTAMSEVEEVELITNFMSEQMAAYWSELVTSPVVLMKLDGVYYSVVVKDTAFEKEYSLNDKLINKKVTVTFANQNNINV